MSTFVEYTCPFCLDKDFDLYGLQFHLQIYCEVFGKINDRNLIIADYDRKIANCSIIEDAI